MTDLGTSLAGAAGGNGGANDGGVIKDSTEATFMADVIQASQEVPVIVDFWAPWCGPCKQLGPALEQAVREQKGKVRLVKVDVDQNQRIAAQLRVQSIPAVYAFYQGQPVDGFMGAVPASEVQAFVKRLADMTGEDDEGGGIEEALEQAEQMLEQGAASDAAQVFAAILGEEPKNARALAGLARAELAVGGIEQAKQTLDSAPAEIQNDAAIQAARSAIELAEQTQGAGEVAELRARLEANPDDHQARFDLALALVAKKQREEAVDELLELYRRAPQWNEGAAKEQLFKLFESFGPKDPVTLSGRRRLSSMIFT